MENFNREMQNIGKSQMELLEIKDKVTEMKNSVNEQFRRLYTTEERIKNLKTSQCNNPNKNTQRK